MKRLQSALSGKTNGPVEIVEIDYSIVFFGIGRDCDTELLERIASPGNLHVISKYSHINSVVKPLFENVSQIKFGSLEYSNLFQ